jgi:hypothetical protein
VQELWCSCETPVLDVWVLLPWWYTSGRLLGLASSCGAASSSFSFND